MGPISYKDLVAACTAGGASTLSSVTELRPAAGQHAAIAPAKFTPERGSSSVYSFGKRYVDDEVVETVVVDGKSSQLNRVEAAIVAGIEGEDELLGRVPRIEVSYEDEVYSDLELPHRFSDGHIRAGTVDGEPTTQTEGYLALRNCTNANARPLLEASPGSLVFGSWDSSRRSNQVRFRSALVGEIIGVLADQSGSTVNDPPRQGGARVDPVGMSVQLTGEQMGELLEAQADEMSPGTVKKLQDEVKKAKKGLLSGSPLGLGGIPPALSTLGGVSCRRIIRSHVLSFAALRQLRFGAGPEGDAACRALLAAYALNGLARSDAELNLRANCDLVEAAAPEVRLDERHGKVKELRALTIDEADALLAEALAAAESKAGITWDGVALRVVGNPLVRAGAVDESDEKDKD